MSDNLAWRRQAGPDDWRTRRRTCARQCRRRLAGPRASYRSKIYAT